MADSFTELFLARLFEAYPEWWRYRTDTTDPTRGEAPVTVVRVPCPQNSQFGDLVISTFNREITLSCASWHDHYPDDPDSTDEQGYQDVLRDIAGILNESLVTEMLYSKGNILRERLRQRISPRDFPERYDLLVKRSWRGTFDEEITREGTSGA